jgi:hypothetical protein
VLEKVESLQMPPPKGENQPTVEERRQLIAWINHLAGLPDPTLGARDPGKPLLRRLTRLEYNNTVRDLLGLSTDVFMFPERLPFADKAYFQPATGQLGDSIEVRLREYGAKYSVLLPTSGLPGDNRAEHGYRNRGDANNLSPVLLEKYVALAGEIVAHPELPQRSPVFAALLGVTPPPLPSIRPSHSAATAAVSTVAEFAPNSPTLPAASGSIVGLTPFRAQLAVALREGRAGVFDVPSTFANQTIAAKGGLIKAPFGRRTLEINPNADLWLVGFSTARTTSGPLLLTNKVKGAKNFELSLAIRGEDPDEGTETLAVCVLGRKGQSGRVTLTARFSDATETKISTRIAEGPDATTFFSFAAVPGERITRLDVDGSGFSGDYLLLDDLAFITNGKPQPPAPVAAAPTPDPAPPPGVAATAATRPAAPTPLAPLPERLASFLERAFRRPVQTAETTRYLDLMASAKAAGQNDAAALRVVVQAALSSPSFLFLSEPTDASEAPVRALDHFELATRLSYFLWASMPDAELLAAARAGKLLNPAVLAAQTRRMLRDPKARELSESFAVQWLRLDQLSTAKPDTDLFKAFYAGPQGKDTLHGAMLTEALLLFETVLVEDRSILDFIGADFTWLNPRLAKTYGLALTTAVPVPETVAGAGASTREVRQAANKAASKVASTWHRTALSDPARGGFITMGGPLTVTSLPFRTSPVKRGAWLLETIFNRPPQEPKVAFAIENDTKEAAAAQSIRQKFEAHRSKAACYSCHVRLDPPGFALERFDPIGRWRETDGGQPVDARGEWNGTAFDGPAGYKAALLRDPSEFTRGFTEHLLSYALGRKLELYDLPAVQEIQHAAADDGNRLSRIVVEIVRSYPFRHTRNRDFQAAGQ